MFQIEVQVLILGGGLHLAVYFDFLCTTIFSKEKEISRLVIGPNTMMTMSHAKCRLNQQCSKLALFANMKLW